MESADEIEGKLRDFFATRAGDEGLAAAYLFGSWARGSARPASDVDVGVLYVDAPPPGLDHLEADLEKLLPTTFERRCEITPACTRKSLLRGSRGCATSAALRTN